MSVDAVQARLICEPLIAVADKPAGVLGAVVSGTACVVAEAIAEGLRGYFAE